LHWHRGRRRRGVNCELFRALFQASANRNGAQTARLLTRAVTRAQLLGFMQLIKFLAPPSARQVGVQST